MWSWFSSNCIYYVFIAAVDRSFVHNLAMVVIWSSKRWIFHHFFLFHFVDSRIWNFCRSSSSLSLWKVALNTRESPFPLHKTSASHARTQRSSIHCMTRTPYRWIMIKLSIDKRSRNQLKRLSFSSDTLTTVNCHSYDPVDYCCQH